MANAQPARPSAPKLRTVANAGYRKGEETRRRILDASLKAFGEAPLQAVTTRQIAQAASVSLPTLQYYFGDKNGLYRACAKEIVERYRRHTTSAAGEAAQALRADCGPDAARLHLKAVIAGLAELLVGSSETVGWLQFVTRELREPGPAFEILYDTLWRPGVELITRLIVRIVGNSQEDAVARIQALLLISSVLSFQSGRSISLRAMQWTAIGRKEVTQILAVINGQIDAIGRTQS